MQILDAIRAQRVASAELPSLERAWLRFDDPLAQFQAMVESVGGRVVHVAGAGQIATSLSRIAEYSAAKRVVSTVATVPATIDLEQIADAHELESVDWAVLPGEFAVAENGAIWVTDKGLKHRTIYFIVQHLALVLPAGEIVNNMHEAYQRISVGQSSLGVFISGPSKTADIEQSLVIGAHGPRSLTVLCVKN